eukprot:4350290-Karenia_brevis.AAC.1
MPVAHRAAEAYVFYALLAKLPSKSLQRLGGWTQTSVNPPPLARMLAQEAWRNVRGSCFLCGSEWECKAAPEAAPYPCQQCGTIVKVTCRGHTPEVTRTAAAHEKRAAPAESAPKQEPEPKRPRVSRSNTCLRVKVCGVAYTTLGWFLGASNPNRHQLKKAKDKCMVKAVEISGGDSKTLQAQQFAACPPEW